MIDWKFRGMSEKSVAAQHTESVAQSSKAELCATNLYLHDLIDKLL